MKTKGIMRAWGKILQGQRPALSIEITRECPLRCPGCYAYLDGHLGDATTLRQLSDYQNQELIDRFFRLIDEHDPLHVSIIGGEPLVRFRELNVILPRLAERGIHTQVVTSAVRPIPTEWSQIPATSRSPYQSTVCNRSTIYGAPRQPTTESSSTSSTTGSPCTAPSRGSKRSVLGTSRSSYTSGRRTTPCTGSWSASTHPRLVKCPRSVCSRTTAHGWSPHCSRFVNNIQSCRCQHR